MEKHFGHAVPAAMKELYENQNELTREGFIVSQCSETSVEDQWFIGAYNPADEEAVRDGRQEKNKYFAFADDGRGNQYLVDPTLDDPPVIFHDNEADEDELVCKSLTEFLKWPRRPEGSSLG